MKFLDPLNTKTFAELHRVKHWHELVFESERVQRALTLYAECKVYRNLLLYGPYGSAKSTIAQLLVRERDKRIGVPGAYEARFHGKELNAKMAALEGSFDLLRSCHNYNERNYVIIDEVDQLTPGNQELLRGLMDTLPFGKMIMTTNSLNKIDGGVRDRCDQRQINHPHAEQWLPRAQAILAAEGVQVPDVSVLRVLSATSTARDVLRVLEDLVVTKHLQAQTQAQAQAQAPLANIVMLPTSGTAPTP